MPSGDPAASLGGMTAHAADSRPILIAYDGSDCAKRAINEAASLFPDRRAIVISVWQDVRAMPTFAWAAPASLTGIQDMLDVVRVGAERVAMEGADIAVHAGLDATSEAVEAQGSIAEAIVSRAAQDNVAAIVMGSRGYGGMRSTLLGSVSTGVVHQAHQPVVVARRDAVEA
jgi:nucleotide-binding universal stress UspA family protein